ncbi:MAG: hypothetical protein AB7O59_09015 [Pirellulales bacterium]
MKSVVRCLAAIALFGALAGCRMCQAPFDYCNPAIGPSGALNCDFNARRGSVYHPMDDDPPLRLIKAEPAKPGTGYQMGTPDPEAERGYDPTAEMTEDDGTVVR